MFNDTPALKQSERVCNRVMHFARGWMIGRKERKEMFYLTMHSTHFILRLYGVGHMVKDHSDSEKGNLLPPHGLLFPINCKGSFMCTSCGALAGMRNSCGIRDAQSERMNV